MAHAAPVGPERQRPTMHLTEDDIRGLGSVEVGDTMTLSVKGRITGIHEELYEGRKERHRMVTMELSDVSVEEKNRVRQR